jgi:hypothetical protein
MPESISSCGEWKAAAQRHLAPRMDALDVAAAAHLHAHGAAMLDHHAQRLRVREHREVGARHRRMQVGGRGRAALAVPRAAMELRDLVEARAFLLDAVEVVVEGHARLHRGAHEVLADGARRLLVGHLQRTVGAVQRARAALVALGAAEPGQHVAEGPAAAAGALPVVVVLAVAAHVEHGVDRARAAEAAPARLVAAAAVQARLRLGAQRVVVDRRAARQHRHRGGRRAHQDAAAVAAGLDQAHAHARILAEPRGERGASGAASDDHVVELHRPASFPASSSIAPMPARGL